MPTAISRSLRRFAVVTSTVALLFALLPIGVAQAAVGGPTVSLTSATPNPTNGPIAVTATFSESVSGFTQGDVSASNGTVSGFAGSGTTYTFTVTAVADGTVSVQVPADVATGDVSTLGNVASNILTRTVDTTPPSVTSINRVNSSPTGAASVSFTVTFSEAVSGVTTGAFSLTTTGVTGAIITGLSADTGSTRTVTVNTGTGDGTIRLDLTTTTGIVDAAGNTLSGTFTSGQTYTIDKTLPTVTIAFPVNAAVYVSGTWATVSGTAADNTAVASVKYSVQRVSNGLYWGGSSFNSGSPVYTTAGGTTNWSSGFAFSNFPSDGSYTLRAYATDTAGNVSAAAVSTFTIDTNPSVTLTSTPVSGSITGSAISVTATFSESVTGFVASDVVVTNASLVNFSGSGTTYTFTLLGITSGTITAYVPAGVATGASGTNLVSNTLTWTFDTSGPTVTVNQASGQVDPTGVSPINFTAVFSAPVTGFNSSDVTVSGTAAGTKTVTITALSTQTYTISISGMTSSGTVTVSIPADAVLSITGSHPNRASTSTDNTVSFILPAKWVVTASSYTPVPGSTITVSAQLADVSGNAAPGSGVVVTWSSTNGGSFSSTTSTTNAAGVATVNFTVSTTVGTVHTVTATGASLIGTSANIVVTANPAVITLSSSLLATTYRQSVTLTAQFAANGSNRTIMIQRLSPVDATWATIGTLTTNTFGTATMTYAPPYNTFFRASFGGANDLSAANSPSIRVLVRHKLTFAAGGTSKFYRNGTRVTYTAMVRPIAPAGLQRITFLIYKRVAGHWVFRTSATIRVNALGQATFSWRWTHGQWYIRARGNATIYNAATLSPIAKVTIP